MDKFDSKVVKVLYKIFGLNYRKKVYEYLYSVIFDFLFLGVCFYVDQWGWILFGFIFLFIHLGGLLYAFKNKKRHPLVDILYTFTFLAAFVTGGIVYYENDRWWWEILIVIMVIMGLASLRMQFADWLVKRNRTETEPGEKDR